MTMTELPRGAVCPQFVQSQARGKRVAEALSDKWRTAGQIGLLTGDIAEDVRYQLVKLTTKGEAERLTRPGVHGPRHFYRRAR